MSEPCMFCGQPATRWCDRMLAMPVGGIAKTKGRPPYRVTTMQAMLDTPHTCDAPFCNAHGRVVGHYCAGRNSDTIDHCQGCVDGDDGLPAPLLEPSEIIVLRRRLHAEYRRRRIAAVP